MSSLLISRVLFLGRAVKAKILHVSLLCIMPQALSAAYAVEFKMYSF